MISELFAVSTMYVASDKSSISELYLKVAKTQK